MRLGSSGGLAVFVLPLVLGFAGIARLDLSARIPEDPAKLLGEFGFTSRELADVDRGQPVAKVLETDRRQIAVVGAIRINAPRELLVERFRAVENLKRSAIVLDVGTFGAQPRPDDLKSVPFEAYDLDVRTCRPGDCRVRLSADDIARFHRDVDWRSPNWPEQSAGVWRTVLAGYAAGYLSRGGSALPVYANKTDPVSVRDELDLLLADSAFLAPYSPEFYRYLKDHGQTRLDGADGVTYWSKEDFGVRPVLRVSRQTIYAPAQTDGEASRPILIATKQIYGDHYLDAALSLTLALQPPGGSSRFYMISVNRVRTRSLTGLFRTFVRSTVQSRSRDAMLKILGATKANLEASAR